MKTMFGGVLSVLKELKVGKVIIGEQGEECEQYQEFCTIVKEKDIQVVIVKKGDIINIEKDVKLRVLFPGNELITKNILNNNSLVAKLEYKDFKMLFTGDIEEVAEQQLIKMYSNGELEADILKVPHHGSKSSSTIEFLEAVNASIALIGVGGNNKFGHPHDVVIERFEQEKIKIYRTDENGEISVIVDAKSKSCIKITTLVNNNSEGL